MDQRRHWRRAFHRIRQPCVQEQLRRFPHRADEQQDSNQVGGIPVSPKEGQAGFSQLRSGGKNVVKLHAVHKEIQRENPEGKAKVPNPVDHKRLDGRGIGAWLAEIKPNQQIRGEAHTLPAEKHLHQVISRHQHQHRKGEQA